MDPSCPPHLQRQFTIKNNNTIHKLENHPTFFKRKFPIFHSLRTLPGVHAKQKKTCEARKIFNQQWHQPPIAWLTSRDNAPSKFSEDEWRVVSAEELDGEEATRRKLLPSNDNRCGWCQPSRSLGLGRLHQAAAQNGLNQVRGKVKRAPRPPRFPWFPWDPWFDLQKQPVMLHHSSGSFFHASHQKSLSMPPNRKCFWSGKFKAYFLSARTGWWRFKGKKKLYTSTLGRAG